MLNMTQKPTRKFYYGYVVVLASLLILLFMHGLGATYGVFLPHLQAEFSTNRTAVSGVTSVAFIIQAFFGIACGRLTDKFGAKPIIIISSQKNSFRIILSQILHSFHVYSANFHTREKKDRSC